MCMNYIIKVHLNFVNCSQSNSLLTKYEYFGVQSATKFDADCERNFSNFVK